MFLQPLMLIGLTAMAIPIIIHLLNRRRYEVVDWGAMRFLQMSQVTRRRLFLEELLLMLLRMALLAMFVIALAGLLWGADLLAWMQPHRSRAVVLIFDGSASMDYNGDGKTPHEAAKEWAGDFLKQLAANDRVAVLQARQQVLPVVAEPSRDLKRQVPDAIRDLPAPGGGCDLPRAVAEANKILAASPSGDRTIIVLTDGQGYGWSDDISQQHWKNLGDQLRHEQPHNAAAPGLFVVNVAPKRDPDPPNWSLDPLTVDFPVIPENSEVTFKTAVRLHGSAKYTPPKDGLELDVDGQLVKPVPAPAAGDKDAREIPLTFTHSFTTRGSHLVTLAVKPDEKQDTLPDDNHADYVVEVTPPMPVLYVDGNPDAEQVKSRGRRQTLLGALDLEKDAPPALKVTARSISEFDPALLAATEDRPAPLVLVLSNVQSLTETQQTAIKTFLEGGGGVLVTLGDRVNKDEYNKMYVGGLGWLPAALTDVEGDEGQKDDLAKARIAVAELAHPIMDRYRKQTGGGLKDATFPKWWQVDVSGQNARGVVAADMKTATKTIPFLVERQFGAGRVMLCSVPLDNAWGENLPTRADFVPLVHDLVYYLAGARATQFNLQPGQPISYRLASGASPNGFRLQPPVGLEKPLSVGPPSLDTFAAQETPDPRHTLVCNETREAGVYRLLTPDGDTVYYVVQGAPGESDLKAGGDADLVKAAAWATHDPGVHRLSLPDGRVAYYDRHDRDAVELLDHPSDQQVQDAKPAALQYASEGTVPLQAPRAPDRPDNNWRLLFLIGVIAVLCCEVWMTRRMVKQRS